MTRRIVPVIGIIALLTLGACGGGAATGAPVASSSAPAATTGAAPGGAACTPTTEAGTVTAAMAEVAFSPGQITAKVGDVIAWTNNDDVTHTATLKDDPACTTANLDKGAIGALKFGTAGTYAFFCKIHSSMTGTIEVTG